MKKWFPWIMVACFALWFLSGIQEPPRVDGFDVAGFARLPVLLNGRIQPFDSVARNALLSISGRSTVRLASGQSLSASQWTPLKNRRSNLRTRKAPRARMRRNRVIPFKGT